MWSAGDGRASHNAFSAVSILAESAARAAGPCPATERPPRRANGTRFDGDATRRPTDLAVPPAPFRSARPSHSRISRAYGKAPSMNGPRMRSNSLAGTRPANTRASVPRLIAPKSARTRTSPGSSSGATGRISARHGPTYQSASVSMPRGSVKSNFPYWTRSSSCRTILAGRCASTWLKSRWLGYTRQARLQVLRENNGLSGIARSIDLPVRESATA